MKGVIRQIFADHLPAVLRERELGEREWRGVWCVATCRTAAQGTHAGECPDGHGAFGEAFNSCRHRGCPQCGGPAARRWVELREAQAPACAHVHTVWTVPDAFGPLWAFNRRAFTNMMFRASWETVRALMGDPKWCGALPGVLSVFQSWGDHLQRHPHVHALVTAGGADAGGVWREPKHAFVICARAAMALYRGRMRALILAGLADGSLASPPGTDAARWRREADRQGLRKWNVRVQPPYAAAGRVIRYVGAYLRRGPLGESRVLAYDGRTVRIARRHPEKHSGTHFELDGAECARRLLAHMPEPRLHTSRLYGLYHPAAKALLAAAHAHFAGTPAPQAGGPGGEGTTPAPRLPQPAACPVCGLTLRVRVTARGGQSPPSGFRSALRGRAA